MLILQTTLLNEIFENWGKDGVKRSGALELWPQTLNEAGKKGLEHPLNVNVEREGGDKPEE